MIFICIQEEQGIMNLVWGDDPGAAPALLLNPNESIQSFGK